MSNTPKLIEPTMQELMSCIKAQSERAYRMFVNGDFDKLVRELNKIGWALDSAKDKALQHTEEV